MQNMMNKLPAGMDWDMITKLLERYGNGMGMGQPPMQNKGPAPFSPGKGMGDVVGAASGMAGAGRDAQDLAEAVKGYGQGPMPSFKEMGQGSQDFLNEVKGDPRYASPMAGMSSTKIPKANGPQRVSPGMYKGADGKVVKSKTKPR
jgi:hypothetical protein